MKQFLFALAECEELVAMTRKEYNHGCERGSMEVCLMFELCEIKEPTRRWVAEWVSRNRPDLKAYRNPYQEKAKLREGN